MKTLIVYSSTHGCTAKAANELGNFLGGQVEIRNLKKEEPGNLETFDRVIIGGSIHAGQIQKRVKDFCTKNVNHLKQKELGLFICCMEEGENAQKQLLGAFPEELIRNAKATACFGGEFDFEKMNFLQKMIVKKVAHVNHSTSKFDKEAIRVFSKKMDKVFNPFLFLV